MLLPLHQGLYATGITDVVQGAEPRGVAQQTGYNNRIGIATDRQADRQEQTRELQTCQHNQLDVEFGMEGAWFRISQLTAVARFSVALCCFLQICVAAPAAHRCPAKVSDVCTHTNPTATSRE